MRPRQLVSGLAGDDFVSNKLMFGALIWAREDEEAVGQWTNNPGAPTDDGRGRED